MKKFIGVGIVTVLLIAAFVRVPPGDRWWMMSVLFGGVLVALWAASSGSRQLHREYLARLETANLDDPAQSQEIFREMAQHVFPLLFCGAVPLAILMDFVPVVVWAALHEAAVFETKPLLALYLRLLFFNSVVIGKRYSNGAWDAGTMDMFRRLAERHARLKIPYHDPALRDTHTAVLGWVLWSAELLAAHFGPRPLTPRESEAICRWLGGLAAGLGIKDFPKTADELRTFLAYYLKKVFGAGGNEKNGRQMLDSLLRGTGSLLPGPLAGWLARWQLRVLFAIAPGEVVASFAGTRRRLPLSVRCLRPLARGWNALFPYRSQAFDFGDLVKFVEWHLNRAQKNIAP